MARLTVAALFGVLVGVIGGAACGIKAQTEPTDDTIAAANDAGLNAVDVQGAINSQPGLDARTYLTAIGALTVPSAAQPASAVIAGVGRQPTPGVIARVRLTWYALTGRTASGGQTYPGAAACSWNWPFQTRFRFADGEVVTCVDRGLLGSSGWLDIWNGMALVRKYGPYTDVEVVLP